MEFNKKNINHIIEHCMNEPAAYEARPFGEYPYCYKVFGKIFAQLNPEQDFFKLTLKCDPEQGMIYRQMYPDIVVRGYHCPPVQQPYWNTIDLYRFDDLKLICNMIDEAYDAVILKMTRKARKQYDYISDLEFRTEDCTVKAYEEGRIVGSGSYTFYDEEHANLVNISVDTDHKEPGIEAEIIRRLEANAKMSGFRWCIVTEDNTLSHILTVAGYRVVDDISEQNYVKKI